MSTLYANDIIDLDNVAVSIDGIKVVYITNNFRYPSLEPEYGNDPMPNLPSEVVVFYRTPVYFRYRKVDGDMVMFKTYIYRTHPPIVGYDVESLFEENRLLRSLLEQYGHSPGVGIGLDEPPESPYEGDVTLPEDLFTL